MSISVVIPYYECDEEKKDVLKRCVNSIKGQYDELILVAQPKGAGIGFVPAINKGYELASGDYIIMCCDDVILKEGKLKQLCDPDSVVSAHIEGMPYQDFWGTLWCTPRWVYEKVGNIDEEYAKGLYYDDNEYYEMVRPIAKPYTNIRVVIDHPHGGRTLEKSKDREAKMEHNKSLFFKKYGHPPHILTGNTAARYGLQIASMY